MKNLLLVALLALVAAGLFFVLGGDSHTPESAAATATAPPAEPSAVAPEATLVQPEGETAAGASATRRTAANATLPEFVEPVEERPDAVQTGLVVDALGNPVAGARVLATTQGFLPVDVATLPNWMTRVETTTDAAGRFELAGLAPANLRLAVRKSGFAPYDDSELGLPDEETLELPVIQLETGAIVSGRVVDSQGLAVADARLVASGETRQPFFFGGAEREPAAVTDHQGGFRIDVLAAGPFSLRVEHPEHPSKSFDGMASTPGAEVGGLELVLDPSTNVRGRVAGIPKGVSAEVSASRTGVDWDPSPRRAPVAADGSFDVGGLAEDAMFTLQVRSEARDGYWDRESLSRPVRARSGDSGVLLEYLPSSGIVLRVVDDRTGEPIEALRVEAGVDWPRALRDPDDASSVRETFPDGLVEIEDLRLVDDDDAVLVTIESPGYEDLRREDLRPGPGEVLDLGELRLTPVPVYAVTVLDASTRAPIEGALVAARPVTEEESAADTLRTVSLTIESSSGGDIVRSVSGNEESTGITDAEGVARFNALGVPRVEFSATADGYARGELDGVDESEGGETEATLLLSHGGSVLVQVLEADGSPATGQTVEHRQPSEGEDQMRFVVRHGGGSNRTNARGEVLFENLELGPHRFRLADDSGSHGIFTGGGGLIALADMGDSGDEEDWVTAEVVEGETAEVVLEAPPTARLAGRVTENGVALLGAELSLAEAREGSSNTALAGFGFGGGPQARSTAGGAYSFDSVETGTYTLTVRHATRRMPMEFEVEVREGETEFDVDLPLSILEGVVRDAEGQPVVGARVSASRDTGDEGGAVRRRMLFVADGGSGASLGGGDLGGESTTTDAEGRYRLRGILPDVKLVVRVEGGAFQPATSDPVEVGVGETRTGFDVEVQPGGTLAVIVRNGADEPVGMCVITAAPLEGQDSEPRTEFVQSGDGLLEGLAPGSWSVSLRQMGRGEAQSPAEQVVEVRSGETADVRFDLP